MKPVYLLLLMMIASACSPEKKTRETLDFTEGWKFQLGDDAQAASPGFDDQSWRTLDLPHDWSIENDFSKDNPATPGGGALPGGVGWYRKTFTVPKKQEGKRFLVDFDGVYWNSEVWLNGQSLGKRPSGYISFRYDLTPHIRYGQPNVLAVRVDNSQQPNSRWYSGSGIYRNVRLVIANPVYVDLWGTYVTTPVVSNESARIAVRTTVKNEMNEAQDVTVRQVLQDATKQEVAVTAQSVRVDAGSTEVVQELGLATPHLWNIDDPYLYTLVTTIEADGKLLDEYHTPVGIRSFSFDANKGFILNGKNIKINGVCNHHDLGCLGTAVNTRAIERQLEILKEMGCNGIRCSHNPPAPELLDLCDRMGFIVMDETFDMWRKRKSKYDYSRFFPEWYERDLTDLILRDRNHPSVFMWSIGNEVLEQWSNPGTDTLSLQEANILLNSKKAIDPKEFESGGVHINSLLTQRLAEIVKSLDPTRPVTAGNNETSSYNYLFRSGALDIIGFNYHTQQYAGVPQNYPGKPFIAAETVSGLMTRGYYMMPSDKMYVWPERWDKPFTQPVNQCSAYDNCHVPWGTNHETTWKEVKKLDFCAGQYIWTGFDYMGEPTPFWWPSRSSYFGIIDLAGFPKDVYYMYQSEWTDQDVLHVFPHWNWKHGDTIDIWTYYNHADEVELFLNGKSLGSKNKTDEELHVWWRVAFEPGTLKAISRKAGKEVLTREIKTAGKPVKLRLTADRQTITADGKDLSFITVEALDKDGVVVPTANHQVYFTLEGNGTIAGTDNGNPTDHVSLSKPERHMFNGKCLAVLKAGRKQGALTLKATADGLDDATVEIETK